MPSREKLNNHNTAKSNRRSCLARPSNRLRRFARRRMTETFAFDEIGFAPERLYDMGIVA